MKPAAIATALIAFATSAYAGEDVIYPAGGDTFEGYLARADAPAGTIVVLPTWSGLSDYEKDRAQMLANLGYTTLAADLYRKGGHPRSMEERHAGLKSFVTDPERMRTVVRAAIEEARSHGGEPLIVMGYSLGAIAAMELAWSGIGNDLGVDGYVVFSGRVWDDSGRMLPEGLAPVFVAHGEADTMIPPAGIVNFVNDADLAGSRVTVRTYPGAGHMFSAFGFPAYDEAADLDSWAALRDFLASVTGES